MNKCRRCLLQEMENENDYYQKVIIYRNLLSQKIKTPDDIYNERLNYCKRCEYLESGTCMQCGCYVEIRAARIDMHCPLDKNW